MKKFLIVFLTLMVLGPFVAFADDDDMTKSYREARNAFYNASKVWVEDFERVKLKDGQYGVLGTSGYFINIPKGKSNFENCRDLEEEFDEQLGRNSKKIISDFVADKTNSGYHAEWTKATGEVISVQWSKDTNFEIHIKYITP